MQMIRQTGCKAIFFICKANHQSWLWFPPGDLFVMVVVASRTWKVFAILSFSSTFLLTSTRLVWSPMTCPVKGSTGKGFLLLLTKLALSTSPTNPDGAAVGIFPDIGPDIGATLAGVGGPKRLLNELLEHFVRLVVGFKAGCSSPIWNVEAILLSVLNKIG